MKFQLKPWHVFAIILGMLAWIFAGKWILNHWWVAAIFLAAIAWMVYEIKRAPIINGDDFNNDFGSDFAKNKEDEDTTN